MTELFEAARLLGVPGKNAPLHSQVDFLAYVDKGLPVRVVDRIADVIAPGDSKFKYLIVSKATWARKKQSGRLSKPQSELVTRLAEVWSDAMRIWKSADDARDFLHRPHQLLGNRKPINLLLQSEIGAQLVRDVLAKLEHGAAV